VRGRCGAWSGRRRGQGRARCSCGCGRPLLNYRDLLVLDGHYNPLQPLPIVAGADGAGEVTALGEGVGRLRVGDRVTAAYAQQWTGARPTHEVLGSTLGGSMLGGHRDGVLAEYALFDAAGTVRVPDHLSYEEASTLPVAGVTAWSALYGAAPLRPGETVLVQGTGGVAAFTIQLARAGGARVIVTSRSDQKLARALELGAHHGVNSRTTPEWDVRALELTGGAGVDRVIDLVGTELGRSVNAARIGGVVAAVGVLGGVRASVDLFPLLVKMVRIQGINTGSRDTLEELASALALHRLRPVIDRVFAFDEAVEAYAALRAGGHFGKLVIRGA
jgi:NADPH:quinone reductase-like Zn-dependent oxidoreductase